MDLANLIIKVDSSSADNAASDLDKLGAAGKRTNVTVEQAERHMRKASIVLGDMAKAERTAAVEADRLAKSTKGAGQAASEMAKEAQRAADNVQKTAGMSKAASFAARNLSYQMTDVVQGFVLGQKPMQIFAQQGFQIADALGQMAYEAKKANKSLASMVFGSLGKAGPIIGVVAVALGGLAGALKVVQDDINGTSKATLSYGDVALGTFDALRAFLVEKLGPAFEWLADMVGTAWDYIASASKTAANVMVGVMIAAPKTIYAAFTTLPQAIAELFIDMANGAIEAIEDLINEAVSGLNKFSGLVNGLLGTSIGGIDAVRFGRIENSFSGAGKRAGVALAEGIASGFGDHWGDIAENIRPFAETRMRARLAKDAEDAGKRAGAAGGKAMADEWAKEFEKNWRGVGKSIGGILKDADDFANALDDDLEAALKAGSAEWKRQWGERQEAIRATQEQVDALVSSLSRMSGLGGVLGDIGYILTDRNPIAAMLGMGGIGTIAGSLLGGNDVTKRMGDEFSKSLVNTFGVKGELADSIGGTLANVFQGAAIGGATASILGGGKGGQIGGQLGGAAGMAIAGPIGAVVGSVLGNVLGGALSSTKRGGATLGVSGVTGTWGNSDQRIGASTDLANNAIAALGQIAEALGAELGSFSSSVSVRKGNLRFDPTGSGISKTSKGAINFGQDEAGLLKAVIQDAISDGVFEGLSAGVERLLKGEGDVEAQLQKALSFAGVFDELARLKDPQAHQLGELDKWRDQMGSIFDEAGATTEEFAQLEELTALKRKDIIEQFGIDVTELERTRREMEITLMAAQGDTTGALAAARQLELESLDEGLHALQQRIWAVQDAAQADAEWAARVASSHQTTAAMWALEADIMDLQGNAAGALHLRRTNELRAMDESLRALTMRKYALEDEAEALAQVQAIAAERYSLETRLLQLMGDTATLRARELALLNPANRAIQQQIYGLEDQQSAANALVTENNRLISSYSQQESSIQSLRDKFAGFAADITAYRAGLFGEGPGAASANFNRVASMAALGDEKALSGFTGAADAYLADARNSARTLVEYNRAVGMVAGAADKAIAGADGVARMAEEQLATIRQSVGELERLNVQVMADAKIAQEYAAEQIEQADALDELQGDTIDAIESGSDSVTATLDDVRKAILQVGAEVNLSRNEAAKSASRAQGILDTMDRRFNRWNGGDYIKVGNDEDTPVYTDELP